MRLPLFGFVRLFSKKINVPEGPLSFFCYFSTEQMLKKTQSVRKCWGRNISSPAIWATKISAHSGDINVAQMSRQICSHTPSALNAGAKRSGATCHMAMPQYCYLAKGAKRPSHSTNMLTSLSILVN